MLNRSITLLVAGGLSLGALGVTTAATAQTQDSPSKSPQGQEMMNGHGGMMGDGMMGNMDSEHMKQMTKMMENCNRMMERADSSNGTPTQQ
ncbi:hypothetical protein [Enhydrobacter sp.]|jgi:Spy/CpxP family protein refolding chaperone|uniref:hypothetical protein n=1 Tax=Enhydrobacter sp. TaxID=1894999 RepID=UPI002617B31E|nr:hypothetical protein [Enhydrobacter sp.]WIM09190.1 MAG: hypothetical protein OJF58_000141 [Enhydrobacter sp.]